VTGDGFRGKRSYRCHGHQESSREAKVPYEGTLGAKFSKIGYYNRWRAQGKGGGGKVGKKSLYVEKTKRDKSRSRRSC